MKKYKINRSDLMHNGKLYREGWIIEIELEREIESMLKKEGIIEEIKEEKENKGGKK